MHGGLLTSLAVDEERVSRCVASITFGVGEEKLSRNVASVLFGEVVSLMDGEGKLSRNVASIVFGAELSSSEFFAPILSLACTTPVPAAPS
jgi:hypothetical protein